MVIVGGCMQRVGEAHPRAKLTDNDVGLIRTLAALGVTYAEIAGKFGISKVTVGRICRFERRARNANGAVHLL